MRKFGLVQASLIFIFILTQSAFAAMNERELVAQLNDVISSIKTQLDLGQNISDSQESTLRHLLSESESRSVFSDAAVEGYSVLDALKKRSRNSASSGADSDGSSSKVNSPAVGFNKPLRDALTALREKMDRGETVTHDEQRKFSDLVRDFELNKVVYGPVVLESILELKKLDPTDAHVIANLYTIAIKGIVDGSAKKGNKGNEKIDIRKTGTPASLAALALAEAQVSLVSDTDLFFSEIVARHFAQPDEVPVVSELIGRSASWGSQTNMKLAEVFLASSDVTVIEAASEFLLSSAPLDPVSLAHLLNQVSLAGDEGWLRTRKLFQILSRTRELNVDLKAKSSLGQLAISVLDRIRPLLTERNSEHKIELDKIMKVYQHLFRFNPEFLSYLEEFTRDLRTFDSRITRRALLDFTDRVEKLWVRPAELDRQAQLPQQIARMRQEPRKGEATKRRYSRRMKRDFTIGANEILKNELVQSYEGIGENGFFRVNRYASGALDFWMKDRLYTTRRELTEALYWEQLNRERIAVLDALSISIDDDAGFLIKIEISAKEEFIIDLRTENFTKKPIDPQMDPILKNRKSYTCVETFGPPET